MSFTATPNGFTPTKSLGSVAYIPRLIYYPIQSGYASNIFQRAPVLINAGYLNVVSTNTSPFLGVAQNFQYQTTLGPIPSPIQPYWQASYVLPTGTTATAGVEIDPNVLYQVQTDTSGFASGATLAQLMVDVTWTSGTTAPQIASGNINTGQSTAAITTAGSAIGSNTNYGFKYIQLAPNVPGGNAYSTAYNWILVKPQNTYLTPGALE